METAAKLIADSNVIGWFQGRMEWGPRALGNRSILANPGNPKMQDILNKKVKHREEFRPFAPAVCDDNLNNFFVQKYLSNNLSRFMLTVAKVKNDWWAKLPAITHIDKTARVQTVSRDENELFYDLIKELGKQTEMPVVINTSFNLNGEPIVCNPEDALKTFFATEIDYLFLGDFLLSKHNAKIREE